VLWTHQSASDEDLRRALQRQRELYQPGSLPLTSAAQGRELAREQARVEEATIPCSIRCAEGYDASVFPEERAETPLRNRTLDSALEAERTMLQKRAHARDQR